MSAHFKKLNHYLDQAHSTILSANQVKNNLLNSGLVETHHHCLGLMVTAYETIELGVHALGYCLRTTPHDPSTAIHIIQSTTAAIKSQESAIEALLRPLYVNSTLENPGAYPDCSLVFEASHFNKSIYVAVRKIHLALVIGSYVCK